MVTDRVQSATLAVIRSENSEACEGDILLVVQTGEESGEGIVNV